MHYYNDNIYYNLYMLNRNGLFCILPLLLLQKMLSVGMSSLAGWYWDNNSSVGSWFLVILISFVALGCVTFETKSKINREPYSIKAKACADYGLCSSSIVE